MKKIFIYWTVFYSFFSLLILFFVLNNEKEWDIPIIKSIPYTINLILILIIVSSFLSLIIYLLASTRKNIKQIK